MTSFKIRRSDDPRDIEKIMSIVATFGGGPKDLVEIRNYISNELKEVGDNRYLYLLEDSSRIVGMVQLILKNADNDPELADGKTLAHIHALQVSKDLNPK